MTTATLQLKVQRSRFAHRALAALGSLAPASWLPRVVVPARHLSASQTASQAASREAQEVREMAYAYSRTDPGFASDLYAAAARHEGLYSH